MAKDVVVSLSGWKAREKPGGPLRTIYSCSDCGHHAFKLSCTGGSEGWGPVVVECANCERPQALSVQAEA